MVSERITSAVAAAERLGVTKPTLYQWKARGCPWKNGGAFPVEKMKAWHESSIRKTKPTTGEASDREEPEPGDLGWSVRKIRADALFAETKYKKEAGKLVFAKEVTQQFSQVVIEMTTMMKQLPARVSGLTDNPEVKRVLQDRMVLWIDDICETCSRSLEKTIGEILGDAID